MIKMIVIPVAALLICACSSVKKTDDQAGKENRSSVSSPQLPDSIYRFTVSFISIGSGIDHQAHEEFNAFIKKFGEQNSVTIRTEKSSWGREGESDYCMKLQELTSEQQEKFIAATKDILQNSKRVRYRENSTCRSGRRSDSE